MQEINILQYFFHVMHVLNVTKCNLGEVKKKTMLASGHFLKYMGGLGFRQCLVSVL